MPGAAVSDRIGNTPINNSFQNADVQSAVLGTLVQANDPYWGGGEYVYCRSTAALAQFAAGGLRFAETRYPYLPENDSEKCAVLGMDGGLLIRRTERGGVGFALAVLEPQD